MYKLNTKNDDKIKYHEKIRFWISWIFWIKMSLQLISMFGCVNKSWTIFVCPSEDATINGVLLNDEIKYQKWLKKLNFMKKIRFEYNEKTRFKLNEKIRFEFHEKIRFECNEKIRFEFYEKIRFEYHEKIRFE